MHYKTIFGLLSLIIAIISYVPYIRDILSRKTKPHAFSWLVWSMLSGIAFGIQTTRNGGPGAWLMGFTMVATFGIFLLSLKLGEKNIALTDWLCLLFAGLALILWAVTSNPLASIILISGIDAIGGFIPTFRKTFYKPLEETSVTYFIYAIALILSLISLNSFTLINALYPVIFVFINLGMVLYLQVRRQATAN